MNNTRLWFVLIIVLSIAPRAVGQAGLRPPTDPASWVPTDALAYLGISDFGEFAQRFEQTGLYKFIRDPAMRDSWKSVTVLLELHDDLRDRLAKSLDTKPELLKNPFGGPLAIFIPSPQAYPPGKPQIVFVAHVADADLMKNYYERAIRTLNEVADRHEKIPYAAYTIDCFYTDAAEKPAVAAAGSEPDELSLDAALDESDDIPDLDHMFRRLLPTETLPEELVLCLTEDRLIAAGGLQYVKDVLARTDTDNSLLASEAYRTLERRFESPGTLRYLIDLHGWFELIRKSGGSEAEQALTLLGANCMRGIIGHAAFDGADYDSKSEALLLLEGERSGLVKLLEMKNQPVAPGASIDADSLFYARLSADVSEFYKQLEQTIRQVDHAAADQLRDAASIKFANGEVLNVRSELLEHLTPPLSFMLAFEQPYGAQSTRFIISLAHKQRPALARFLKQLADLFPGMLLGHAVGDLTVYDSQLLGLALTVTDRELLIGTCAAIEAAIPNPRSRAALADNPTFKQATALVASEAWGVVYVDTPRMYAAILELHKYKDSLVPTQPANALALAIVNTFTSEFVGTDPAVIERLKSYQNPNIFTLTSTPEGIQIMHARVKPARN